MIGYGIGSFLFDIGNYILPFYVNSAGIFMIIPLFFKYLPSNDLIN